MASMRAPASGVTVRMYRHGHGDCFLLAFRRGDDEGPLYALIDCGYKPGSEEFLPAEKTIDEVVEHIGRATGRHLHLVVITHEHQDHVNGIGTTQSPKFAGFQIDEAWLAWTEDPRDRFANRLRREHGDQLLRLGEAHRRLALGAEDTDPGSERLQSLLELETGEAGGGAEFGLALSDPARSKNKQAMKWIKDTAATVRYLRPGGRPASLPGTGGVHAHVLGPPRLSRLLRDEDPREDEEFPSGEHPLSFSAALGSATPTEPFSAQYREEEPFSHPLFRDHYGEGPALSPAGDQDEVPTDAPWRRIGGDWLSQAEHLALKLNRGVNNTSLVLAFELPQSNKVLLFAGDAQRGSWNSWSKHDYLDASGNPVEAADLIGRTVLYKVGHHGSHNATLNGRASDRYANLEWMGRGAYAGEFAAMIPAVNEWAMSKNRPPWRHPLPSIRKALLEKADGRVFQSDLPPRKPSGADSESWAEFRRRAKTRELYFDYTVLDQPVD